jgi:hypothetical protein
MNKVTDPQPRIYAFIYELGKMPQNDRDAHMKEVSNVTYDYYNLTPDVFCEKYPEFKLGREAQAAKSKVEDLKPKKKTKKEKK